ncbi:winged helix-turn-helix transcriptional regulator [Luteolibacter pohnpeiensis]|uniref:Winged helix-turn-helix transcriptional regulator n=1 Tax=Luteolibacter pohnpeiensis TaxID=454153 RepID=A0A934S5W2_9BACT|nr:metalloregulator ArsR/SmtB family transcription factor [Luteolibacter pohnpeiensis]MBK1881744.1 winged helix-turn-helix transcriptional regulator [Luteolibacter pohnpeiensis]
MNQKSNEISQTDGKLDARALEKVAETFRILSEPGRLSLLQELKSAEMTVGELVEATQQGQASVSKHLKLMHSAQLLTRRKEGVKVYYSVKDETVFALCKLVCGKLAAEQQQQESIDFSL